MERIFGLSIPSSVEKSDSKERDVDDGRDHDNEGDMETSDKICATADHHSTEDEVAESTADISMANLLVTKTESSTSQGKDSAPSSIKYEQEMESRETGDEDEEVRTKQCPICGKVVQTGGSLTRHMHKAHGIFKWSCDLCDEKFITKRDLRKHVNRNHNDNSSNQCPVCGKVFGADIWLIRHLHKEHGVSKYPCNFCNEKFTRKFEIDQAREQEP